QVTHTVCLSNNIDTSHSSMQSPPRSTLFPYTTLFRSACSSSAGGRSMLSRRRIDSGTVLSINCCSVCTPIAASICSICAGLGPRSEEHTSELQSREKLVCRLLLEKKNQFIENI